jgi:AbrB family looped-hinge helix DNA binding protein
MRTTMDGGGRVVIPKDVRSRLGWGPGQEFEIFEVDGQLVLQPPTVPMRAVLHGATTIAVTDGPMPPLSARAVRDVLEQTRR